MKAEILRAIRNSQEHISGQELCERFGVSRTAVWKVIKQLQAEGYDIEAVTNKGYKLLSYPDLISACELMSRVNTEWAGRKVYFRRELTSTNEYAKIVAEEGAVHGALVVADKQNAGRGRRGRVWVSPAGQNIYMSLLLRPDFPSNNASMLTLLMAVSVAEVLHHLHPELPVGIKWPNDVLIGDKKVCGILTEMDAEPDYIHNVIVGVGINVNQTEFDEELQKTATSLKLEKGMSVDRAQIILGVMDYFEYYYGLFAEHQDVSDFVNIYDSYLVNRGREVRVLDPKGEFTGVAEGINDRGELIVNLPGGGATTVSSGEVSVRGIYGYV
ncbi:MAG: biotin--[Lachnospiraceae bacterium]|nr:biotin--[acetyl-CoA-carboxylase] ligase [Lachnospiraceae bacterium]